MAAPPSRPGRTAARIAAVAATLLLTVVPPVAGQAHAAVDVESDMCALGPRTLSTSGADLIIGTPGRDTLSGGGGDDEIYGCGGNDTIYGGDGSDWIEGGGGNDYVDGGPGDDIFDSGHYRTYAQYFKPGIPLLQGNANTVNISFTVDPMQIRTFQVRFDVSHMSPSDLKVKLITPLPSTSSPPVKTVVLTDKNCYGPSTSTNHCGPGQFHNPNSPEAGVLFTSDAATSIQDSGAKNHNLDGMFHPRGTLDGGIKFQPSSCNGSDCTYTLQFTDTVSNGIKGTINYAALDIEPPSKKDGHDTYIGGTGANDLATYVSRSKNITYNGEDNLPNDGQRNERDNVENDIEWFYAGTGNDNLTGTNNTHGGWNDLRGYVGNDTEYGLNGNDRLDLHSGAGADTLYGGNGNDQLGDERQPPPPLDTDDGGVGTDTCYGAASAVSCEVLG
jgi:Ca2+-binding RTX toxin-like protein